ncbi:MAG: septum formation inhibitor Maf [Deltaproteobacteria bacterium]|nr:septum formation inhibitor Maf [Deltaproteobacteria bacterium]MBW2420197.1 septum formation inhibitor Maf [Deltaproteobacteria bacterium]
MTTEPPLPLVLASGSPRRRQLLSRAGVEFEVIPADIPELQREGEAPRAFAERLAGEKALAVAQRVGPAPRRWVLGADTIVVLGDAVLGKPDDPEHAVQLLSRLVGRRHRVITGVALVDSEGLRSEGLSVTSEVSMHPASADEIRSYVATGESLDKAGAYALQGEGRRFVDRVEGSESNVIGLPLAATLELLAESAGLTPGSASAGRAESA